MQSVQGLGQGEGMRELGVAKVPFLHYEFGSRRSLGKAPGERETKRAQPG